MKLKLLSREDIVSLGCGNPADFISTVEAALVAHAEGQTCLPLKPYLKIPGDSQNRRIIAMPAYLGADFQTWGLKWIASAPLNPVQRNTERASAVIVLNDLETGYPVAIMEGGLLSAVRTVAVAMSAIKYLASKNAKSLAIIGNGFIGSLLAKSLLRQNPNLKQVFLYDILDSKKQELAEELSQDFSSDIKTCGSARSAILDADIVSVVTTAQEDYIEGDWFKKGSLFLNISLRDPKFSVIHGADKLVVDNWEQCNRSNTVIHKMTQAGVLSRDNLYCELPEIISGKKKGRETAEEIIVFNPMGLAIMDIAVAQQVYQKSLESGAGKDIEL